MDRVKAQVTAKLRDAELAHVQDRESERNSKLNSQIQALTTEVARLSEELNTSRALLATAKAENANNGANLAHLSASHEQFALIVESMRKELNERRGQALDQQKKIIELADESDRLKAELDSLTRQVRQYQETTVALEDRNAGLEKMMGRLDPAIRQQIEGKDGDGAVKTQPFMPDYLIDGKITNIARLDDETFVEMNVGSNDGVEKNMKFRIHRNGDFIANVVVTVVDIDACSGRITLVDEGQQVTVGDSVQTGGL
jgi:outer membrane murein-binding lipoprotein Lpp